MKVIGSITGTGKINIIFFTIAFKDLNPQQTLMFEKFSDSDY